MRYKLAPLLYFIVGCTQRININKHFDKTASFTVLVSDTTNKKTASFKVIASTPEHARLVHWLENNQSDWQTAAASFIGDILVRQNEITLIRLRNKGVLISFPDEQGKHLQYTKECDRNDLEFLNHQ